MVKTEAAESEWRRVWCSPVLCPESILRTNEAVAAHIHQFLCLKDNFETGDHGKQVGEIEVAEVRDAEDLPLHRSLTIGDDRSEAALEFLDDDLEVLVGILELALEAAPSAVRRRWPHPRRKAVGGSGLWTVHR